MSKYCVDCGNEIEADANFCVSCGRPLKHCQDCGKIIASCVCKQEESRNSDSEGDREIEGAFLGGITGLLVSYLFRPNTFFGSPTIGQWFGEGIKTSEYGPVIVICGVIGSVVGWLVGRNIKV